MAGDTVQQIKDRLSIVDVVSQYVKLERAGQSLRARCPFHAERTPSFFVSPERGTYHCFGCNVGGDIFSFVQQIEGLDFKGALKVLAEKAGVEIVYSRNEKESKDERERLFELMEAATIFYMSHVSDSARAYLKERGLTDATIKNFRLGFAGDEWSELSNHLRSKKYTEKEIVDTGVARKNERGSLVDKFRNRIVFPIADSAGRVVGFSGRIFLVKPSATGQATRKEEEFKPPKYLNSPETSLFHKSRILYGFDKAKVPMRKHNCAVLVEGQLDLLASNQAGWGNTVAVSGTAFTVEHATLIRRVTDNLVIALDPDAAGIKAAGRAARAALSVGLNVKVAKLPSGLDPADLILKEGKDAWSAAIRDAKDIIEFLVEVLREHAKRDDTFRRDVQNVVLPFVADVEDPLKREQYVRLVAKKLAVSENSVLEAIAQLPVVQNVSQARDPFTPTSSTNRAKQAFAILLWQRSRREPEFDLDQYERDLESAVGTSVFRELKALPESEQEKLRFTAEQIYRGNSALEMQARSLLDVLLRERLSSELMEATEALRRAEGEGREDQIAIHMKSTKLLTQKIAELHKKG